MENTKGKWQFCIFRRCIIEKPRRFLRVAESTLKKPRKILMVFLTIHKKSGGFFSFIAVASSHPHFPSSRRPRKPLNPPEVLRHSCLQPPKTPEVFRGRRVNLTKPPEVFEVFGSEGGPKSASGSSNRLINRANWA